MYKDMSVRINSLFASSWQKKTESSAMTAAYLHAWILTFSISVITVSSRSFTLRRNRFDNHYQLSIQEHSIGPTGAMDDTLSNNKSSDLNMILI